MALLFGRQRRVADLVGDYAGASASALIPARTSAGPYGTAAVNSDSALRHSAVWACVRIRADHISTLPCDVFRRVGGVQVEVTKPPVLRQPGGDRVRYLEWMYSSQVDLDRSGNAFGIIVARTGQGLPAQIALQPAAATTVRVRDGRVQYRFGATAYRSSPSEWFDQDEVWHEKQYTVPGLPVGLSPVAYAAWSIGEFLSIQDFALTWFGGGGVPRGHLRNRNQTMSPATAAAVKERFKATVTSGDVFVTGSDWEYNMLQAEQTGAEWIEAKKFGVTDIARYFNCPADLIDAAVSGSSVTYANVTQRNLQFLVHNLGPTVIRREDALTQLLPQPQFVKLNTDALLRMDPQTRAATLRTQIESRTRAPSEARALDNLPPFTEAQLAEFDRLFPKGAAASSTTEVAP